LIFKTQIRLFGHNGHRGQNAPALVATESETDSDFALTARLHRAVGNIWMLSTVMLQHILVCNRLFTTHSKVLCKIDAALLFSTSNSIVIASGGDIFVPDICKHGNIVCV